MATRPIDAIAAEVAATLLSAGVTVSSFVGLRFLSEHNAPPRYVWVPTNDVPQPATKRDPDNAYEWTETIGIHCWGRTADETYRMRNNMQIALKRSCRAALEFGPSGWLIDTDDNAKHSGAVYLLNVAIRVPVPNRIIPDDASSAIEPDVEILGTEQTAVAVFPSGEESAS